MTARTLSALLLLLVALLVGCGGDDDGGEEATQSTDVNQLLDETFKGDKQVDSGKIDLTIRVEAEGSEDLQGPVTLQLAGPFQTQGEGKLPQFGLEASFQGAGQNFEAGVTSTGDKGFVSFQGTNYVVSDQVFQQFKAGFEEASKQNSGNQEQSLATLGIDPRKWLTDPKNEGEADVGGTETIKITGGVDVPKLLDDVNTALEKARGLGVQGSQDLPERLTDEQKQQVAEAVKSLNVEIYTGKEDKTLRRIVIAADLQNPEGSSGGAESAKINLDLQLLELNEDQEISEPENPKPFDELLGQLGGLGLGGAAGGGGGSGSGSGGGGSAENLEEYSNCISEAGSDVEKARECAELIAP
jgi:hypothetical protein